MSKIEVIKVLIVDDHSLIREGIKTLLEDISDVKVVGEASNGLMAIDFVQKYEVDIVLMDVDMPEMSGIESTQKIVDYSSVIQVIGLSMHRNKGVVDKMLQAGAKGYILKNTDKESLLFALRNISKGFQFIDKQIVEVKKSTDFALNIEASTSLTNRELEILRLIALGNSNKEISERLFISPKTVDTHRTTLMRKLDIHNIAGIVRYAITNGIIN